MKTTKANNSTEIKKFLEYLKNGDIVSNKAFGVCGGMKDKVSYVLMGLLTLALVLSIGAYILVPVVTFIILSVIDIVFLIILHHLHILEEEHNIYP